MLRQAPATAFSWHECIYANHGLDVSLHNFLATMDPVDVGVGETWPLSYCAGSFSGRQFGRCHSTPSPFGFPPHACQFSDRRKFLDSSAAQLQAGFGPDEGEKRRQHLQPCKTRTPRRLYSMNLPKLATRHWCRSHSVQRCWPRLHTFVGSPTEGGHRRSRSGFSVAGG